MLAYSKLLDKAIEHNKKTIPKWIVEYSNLADEFLSRYGLGKSFFENKLKEQHRFERDFTDITILSTPSSEIISLILGAICDVTGHIKYSACLKDLGFEVGKLIYVYDGLLDFQKDKSAGIFNCIGACYLKQNTNHAECSREIYEFIETTKSNISSLLDKIDLKNNDILIRKILLQDLKLNVIKSKKGTLSKLSSIKSDGATCKRFKLTEKAILGILTGNLIVQVVEPSDDVCGSLGLVCGGLCLCTCGGLCLCYLCC